MKKLQEADTIVGLVVRRSAGSNGVSVGQTDLSGIPTYLLLAIHRFNARPLEELLEEEPK